jgi:hypothetical protein
VRSGSCEPCYQYLLVIRDGAVQLVSVLGGVVSSARDVSGASAGVRQAAGGDAEGAGGGSMPDMELDSDDEDYTPPPRPNGGAQFNHPFGGGMGTPRPLLTPPHREGDREGDTVGCDPTVALGGHSMGTPRPLLTPSGCTAAPDPHRVLSGGGSVMVCVWVCGLCVAPGMGGMGMGGGGMQHEFFPPMPDDVNAEEARMLEAVMLGVPYTGHIPDFEAQAAVRGRVCERERERG